MRDLTQDELELLAGGAEASCTGFLYYLLTSSICCNAGAGVQCTHY